MERTQLIRKLILLLLLFPSLALAQIDIPVQTLGNYFSVGQNLAWGASGTGGFNNNFILPGLGGITTNMCVFVQNNNTSSNHPFNFAAYSTSSPLVNKFTGNSADWSNLAVNGSSFLNGSYFAPNGPSSGFPLISVFLITGATGAHIALSFSGGTTLSGSPDTANIWGMYTFGTSCSPSVSAGATFSYYSGTITTSSSSVGIPLFGRSNNSLFFGDVSQISGCTFDLAVTNLGGTTPTLNVYLQDNDIQTGIANDRVSFVQATTGSSDQQASVSFTGNQNPAVIKTKSLTVGSVVSGALSDNLLIAWTIGGTTPSYEFTLTAHCN